MTKAFPQEKGFRQQSDAVAVAARIMIAKIRRHIESDNCQCCKRAMEFENDG